MKEYNIVILGTGQVARVLCKVLIERNFPIKNLFILGRERKQMSYGEDTIMTQIAADFDWRQADIVFGAVDADVISRYYNKIEEAGCVLIDKSTAFRKTAPLIVPEINREKMINSEKIFASPNCVTIPLVDGGSRVGTT